MEPSKKMNLILFVLFQFMIACSGKTSTDDLCDGKVRTTSFLWRMKRDPPVYFFGTIHVPYTKVWDYIPQNVKRAFKRTENVFFELDLTNSRTVSELSQCQMLPGGTDLREVLPSDLYQRLKRHLDYVKSAMSDWVTSEQKGKGLYADYLYDAIVGNWERKKPVWVMLMINSLTEADVRSRGTPVLDLHLARKASMMGKEVGAVERVEEQCQPLNGLNISQIIFALNQTLVNQERLRHGNVRSPYTTDDLIKQYNCGDLDLVMFDRESQVPQMTNGSFETDETETKNGQKDSDIVMASEIDSYFKNELIYRRNERMAERVKQLLRDNPDRSFFFAVGAGHFLGNDSVIEFLRKDGFEIEHTKSRKRPGLSRKERRNRREERKNKRIVASNKQRVRDLWMQLDDVSTPEVSSSENGVRELFAGEYYSTSDSDGKSHVRLVNRHPTAFPSYLFDRNVDRDSSRSFLWSNTRNKNSKTRRNYRSYFSYPDGQREFLPSDLEALNMKLWADSPNDSAENGGSSIFTTGNGFVRCYECAIVSVFAMVVMYMRP